METIRFYCKQLKYQNEIFKDSFIGVYLENNVTKNQDELRCSIVYSEHMYELGFVIPRNVIKNMIEVGEIVRPEPYNEAKLLLRKTL